MNLVLDLDRMAGEARARIAVSVGESVEKHLAEMKQDFAVARKKSTYRLRGYGVHIEVRTGIEQGSDMNRFLKKFFTFKPAERTPALTPQMLSLGFHWTKSEEGWRAACNTCGGNCGQCGTSLGRELVPNLEQVIKSGGWDTKKPYGFPGRN